MADDRVTLQSRGALQDVIAERAAADSRYRRDLLARPRAVLEAHLGAPLPAGLEVAVVEESADTIYLIAPHVQTELSEEDLDMVAGGGIFDAIGSALGGLFGGGGGGGEGGGEDQCERNYGSFNSQISISSSATIGSTDGR
jgi:hypothetical protein